MKITVSKYFTIPSKNSYIPGLNCNIPLVSFIDVLKEEVNYHTELIINENLKSFRPLSKAKLKGSNFNCNDTNDNNFYEDISKEIL